MSAHLMFCRAQYEDERPNSEVPFEVYVNTIRSGGASGGEFEMSIIQRILDRPIVVVHVDRDVSMLGPVTQQFKPLFLYVDGDQYHVLDPQDHFNVGFVNAILTDGIQRATIQADQVVITAEAKDHEIPGQLTLFHLATHAGNDGLLASVLGPEDFAKTPGYLTRSVGQDGSVWEQVFGVPPKQAYQRLISNCEDVFPVVSTVLVTDPAIHWSELSPPHQMDQVLYFLKQYFDPDDSDPPSNPHPILFHAYARITGCSLYIWMTDLARYPAGQLLPYVRNDSCLNIAHTEPSGAPRMRIDLLMSGESLLGSLVYKGYQADDHYFPKASDDVYPYSYHMADRIQDERRESLMAALRLDLHRWRQARLFSDQGADTLAEEVKKAFDDDQKTLLVAGHVNDICFFDVKGPDHNTALHYLMWRGLPLMAGRLVEWGADPSAVNLRGEKACKIYNNEGYALVHSAYCDGEYEVVRILVKGYHNDPAIQTKPKPVELADGSIRQPEPVALIDMIRGGEYKDSDSDEGVVLDASSSGYGLCNDLEQFTSEHSKQHTAYKTACELLQARRSEYTEETFAQAQAALDQKYHFMVRAFASPTEVGDASIDRKWSSLQVVCKGVVARKVAQDPEAGLLGRLWASGSFFKSSHATWVANYDDAYHHLRMAIWGSHVKQNDDELLGLLKSSEMQLFPDNEKGILTNHVNKTANSTGYPNGHANVMVATGMTRDEDCAKVQAELHDQVVQRTKLDQAERAAELYKQEAAAANLKVLRLEAELKAAKEGKVTSGGDLVPAAAGLAEQGGPTPAQIAAARERAEDVEARAGAGSQADGAEDVPAEGVAFVA